jgi:hypothetical protein
VYNLSYPHPNFKNWWVVYKTCPEMHARRYDEYVGHENDEIYQEKIKVDQNFTVFDGAGLTELDSSDVELLDEEVGASKK